MEEFRKSENIRSRAIEQIKDQEMLADIAKSEIHKGASERAIEKIADQNVLADVAKNAHFPTTREAAKKRIEELRNKE